MRIGWNLVRSAASGRDPYLWAGPRPTVPSRTGVCVLTYTPEVYEMRTNIVLDDELVAEAFRVSAARTKKDLVHEGNSSGGLRSLWQE